MKFGSILLIQQVIEMFESNLHSFNYFVQPLSRYIYIIDRKGEQNAPCSIVAGKRVCWGLLLLQLATFDVNCELGECSELYAFGAELQSAGRKALVDFYVCAHSSLSVVVKT